MERILFPLLFCCLLLIPSPIAAQPEYNPLAVDLARAISRDLFSLNAQPFVKPLVEISNATSNARFFHTAFVGNTKWYIRFGLHTMWGFVQGDQKWYAPALPYDTALNIAPYLRFTPEIAIRDTVGLLTHLLRYILYRGIFIDSSIQVPARAATVVGYLESSLEIPPSYLLEQVRSFYPLIRQYYPDFDTTVIENVVATMPTEFPLPTGGDLSAVVAAVPQLEIGGLWSTELLFRYIPPIVLDTAVGKFSFWGVGIKHQFSEYFPSLPFHAAVQVAYQNTRLENEIGVTNAKLSVQAKIWSANVQISREFRQWSIYSALAFESLRINGTYEYVLPRSLQAQLKLIRWIDQNGDGIPQDDEWVPDPPDYPGDTQPQRTAITAQDHSFKWIIGTALRLGPVSLCLDLNLGTFNLLTVGVTYQFRPLPSGKKQ